MDTSIIAVIPFNSSMYWIFHDSKPTDLNMDDLTNIEIILLKCINEYNPDHEKEYKKTNIENPEYEIDKINFIIDLMRYKRQYIAVINSMGEKEVWVKCFCNFGTFDWKKRVVSFKDCENCF